jgi:hypothetical protein
VFPSAAHILTQVSQNAKRFPPTAALYLVGSLALGDYRPGQSDIDFVAVTGSPSDPSELRQLELLHRDLQRLVPNPSLDGIYVTWQQLQAAPQGLSVPRWLDGRFAPSHSFAATPVTWSTLHRHPLPIRGPATPAVQHDEDLLRAWCRENLQGYWAAWVHASRTRFKGQLFSLSRRATTWGVLGVTRACMPPSTPATSSPNHRQERTPCRSFPPAGRRSYRKPWPPGGLSQSLRPSPRRAGLCRLCDLGCSRKKRQG